MSEFRWFLVGILGGIGVMYFSPYNVILVVGGAIVMLIVTSFLK